MLAKEHVTVFSTFCYHFFCPYNSSSSGNFLSVFLWEVRVRGSFTSDGICMTRCFNVMSGFRLYHSPISNTTLRPVLRDSPQQCCVGRGWDRVWLGLDDVWGREETQTLTSPESTLSIAQYCNLYQERHFSSILTVFILFSRNILTWFTVLHLCYGQNPLWTSSWVNAFCSDREQTVWK